MDNNRDRAPLWLKGKQARAYYRARIKELPTLSYYQIDLLARIASEWSLQQAAIAEYQTHLDSQNTMMAKGSQGQDIVHPLIQTARICAGNLKNLELQLRQSLDKSPAADDVAGDDELDTLMGEVNELL